MNNALTKHELVKVVPFFAFLVLNLWLFVATFGHSLLTTVGAGALLALMGANAPRLTRRSKRIACVLSAVCGALGLGLAVALPMPVFVI